MRSQPASMAWTVTPAAVFHNFWNYMNILFYELDVLYTINFLINGHAN